MHRRTRVQPSISSAEPHHGFSRRATYRRQVAWVLGGRPASESSWNRLRPERSCSATRQSTAMGAPASASPGDDPFVNRKTEFDRLDMLLERHSARGALVVVYGRRRVGSTRRSAGAMYRSARASRFPEPLRSRCSMHARCVRSRETLAELRRTAPRARCFTQQAHERGR